MMEEKVGGKNTEEGGEEPGFGLCRSPGIRGQPQHIQREIKTGDFFGTRARGFKPVVLESAGDRENQE